MNVGVSLLGVVAALFGGAAVAVVSYLTNRGKTKAETAKIYAEVEHVRAQAAALARGGNPTVGRPTSIPVWQLRGTWPDDYEVKLDRTTVHRGSVSALIEATPGARGFGTLMQTANSIAMRGSRIRMSAFVKTDDVERAALWMRVDGLDDTMLAFDNMDDRPIRGTTDWREYEIVLDVDEASREVAFGILLARRGRAWVDDFNFEAVGSEVDTTDLLSDGPIPPAPANLDFEE